MVTNNLKNYTDENIIELIESLKSKAVAYNLNDLKAVLAEVNNRKLDNGYAEVLGEMIRDKILNGDDVTPVTQETVVAPEISKEEQDMELPKEEIKEKKKKEKREKKEKAKVKSIQQKAKEEEIEYVEADKYPVLRFMVGFLKFLGWLSLSVSVIYGLYTSVMNHLSQPTAAIGSIFMGFFVGTVVLLVCYSKAESISVKLDIEAHLEKIAGDK